MRLSAKITLGSGVILLLVGLTITIIGGSMLEDTTPDSEDWSGTLMYRGVTPAIYDGHFEWESYYNVWISESANPSSLKIEVDEGRSLDEGYFVPCEEYDSCDMFDVDGQIPGFQYIGEIYIPTSGDYEVRFNVIGGYDIEVMIREDSSFLGILGSISGTAICCGGLILIIMGSVLAFSKTDKSNSDTQLYHIIEDENNNVESGYTTTQEPIADSNHVESLNWWEIDQES